MVGYFESDELKNYKTPNFRGVFYTLAFLIYSKTIDYLFLPLHKSMNFTTNGIINYNKL